VTKAWSILTMMVLSVISSASLPGSNALASKAGQSHLNL
jgi:hypothetical protein